jgi:uncharacterized delta-60 repeat protein
MLATLLLSLVAITHGSAASGQLDPTFGSGGKVTTDLFGGTDTVVALALQPDGKIIAAGVSFDALVVAHVFGIVRYNADGSIDPSFGVGGKVSTDFFGQRLDSSVSGIAVQSDGKIVAVGGAEALTVDLKRIGHAVAARYNTDGSVDANFGDQGKLIIDFPMAFFSPQTVTIQQDGKILIGGIASPDPAAPANTVFGLERLNRDGTLDSSFGSAGVVMTPFPSGPSFFGRLTIQRDGLIIAVGSARSSGAVASSFELARYHSDGSLDQGLGIGGLITTPLAGVDASLGGFDVAVVDNKIVVAGSALVSTTPRRVSFAAARYNGDGSIDTSFASGGITTADFFDGMGMLTSEAIRSDGKFVAGGFLRMPKSQAKGGTANDFVLEQYNADASVDTGFGSLGRISTEFSDDENDEMYTLAIQPDRKIIAAGSTSGGDDFALARYQTEPDFQISLADPTVSAVRGTIARTSLQLDRFGGFSGNITVNHSDVSALHVRVKPDSLVSAESSVNVKFKVKDVAPIGVHDIVFTGKDNTGRQHSVTLALVVQ